MNCDDASASLYALHRGVILAAVSLSVGRLLQLLFGGVMSSADQNSIWKTLASSAVYHSPFAVMGALATVQGSAILYETWKTWNRRRQLRNEMNTGYGRVMSGQSVSGWNLVLPRRKIIDGGPLTKSRIVQFGWMKQDEHGLPFSLESSILIRNVCPMPDGKRAMIFRRCSLLLPEKFNITLSTIIYDPVEWSHQHACYLTPNNIASLLRQRDTARFRLVISDAFRGNPVRRFRLEAPIPEADVHAIYPDETAGRVRVMFGRRAEVTPDDELAEDVPSSRFELYNASYQIAWESPLDKPAIQQFESCESISIPTGERDVRLSFPISDHSLLVMLYSASQSSHLSTYQCITVDRNGSYKVENGSFWLQNAKIEHSRRKSDAWSFMMNLESFRKLHPPLGCCRILDSPLLRYCTAMETRPIGTAFYAMTKDGVFRRWESPPSLKFLTAEKLFAQGRSRFVRVDGSTANQGDFGIRFVRRFHGTT